MEEKLEEILKRLEGVYKTTIDPKQKERVKKEIDALKAKIKASKPLESKEVLLENESTEKVIKPEVEKENKTDAGIMSFTEDFPILSKIKIEKIHPFSDDNEINMVVCYLREFEKNYWSALSDFHLKLDYNHSRERDKFYDQLEGCNRILRDYIKNLDEFEKAQIESYKERLKMMKLKVGRAFLIATYEFMKSLNNFINYLIQDYNNKGNIILNPDEIIKFSKLEGNNKELAGKTVIEALKQVFNFTEEFLKMIKIPDEILAIKNKP